MITYTDFKYAANRLVGTIITYEGKPVLVVDMMDGEVRIEYLSDGIRTTVPYSNKFDLTPVPLGHTNFNGGAYYVSRIPMRQDWRQGLRETTTRVIQVGHEKGYGEMLHLPFPELAKTILGEYPTLTQVVEEINLSPKIKSMAFCRSFALDKAKNIWFKGRLQIGKLLNHKTREYSLDDKFFWARESLEESLHA